MMDRKKYVVVSGYTIGTQYEIEIRDLEKSLVRFDIPYCFYPYKCSGSWVKNTMRKPELIAAAMEDYPEHDVVWIDADAIVKNDPVFFDSIQKEPFDLCVHFLGNRELLSGTMYLRNNEVMRGLVDAWMSCTGVNWDQKILQALLKEPRFSGVRIFPLPVDYVKIKPKSKTIEQVEGVITHKQASREQRKLIENGENRITLVQAVKGKRVLLVGNGSQLLLANNDDVIDSFDFVVRFNYAIEHLRGHHIGRRFDCWVYAMKNPDRCLKAYRRSKEKPWMCVRYGDGCVPGIGLRTDCVGVEMRKEVSQYLELPVKNFPSTGIVFLYYFLNHAQPESVTTIGFDSFQTKNFYSTKKTATFWHVGDIEAAYRKWLRETGRISEIGIHDAD